MAFTKRTETSALIENAAGVGDSRVLLEFVVRAFQDGANPEAIVQRYSTLALSDVCAVIAYDLRHRMEAEEYLVRREQNAEAVRQQIERRQGDVSEVRARLFAVREPRG